MTEDIWLEYLKKICHGKIIKICLKIRMRI